MAFSSDLALGYEKLIDYYRLRFQIEFNFRDAKQYWGLEDFMNVTQRSVYNGANLSLFMVNLSRPDYSCREKRVHESHSVKPYFRAKPKVPNGVYP